jgi:hypothetical protein
MNLLKEKIGLMLLRLTFVACKTVDTKENITKDFPFFIPAE